MIFIQMTGLSGAGKSTLADNVKILLLDLGYKVEIIDGDVYRQYLCRDLGFSREDRNENIRRLGFVGITLARNNIIAIMATINPYHDARQELISSSTLVKTVWLRCNLDVLIKRDTKGLYQRAFLPDSDPNKLSNLTGINDPYEAPENPDLTIDTNLEDVDTSVRKLLDFILANIPS